MQNHAILRDFAIFCDTMNHIICPPPPPTARGGANGEGANEGTTKTRCIRHRAHYSHILLTTPWGGVPRRFGIVTRRRGRGYTGEGD